MYEFEKYPKLAEFIQGMANTGKAPREWTSFIETLNQALRIHNVVGQSEQLVCDKCGYPMFYHKPDDIMYCHGCNNTKPAK